MYKLIRRFLFLLDAEQSHHFTLFLLKTMHTLGLTRVLFGQTSERMTHLLGLSFPNPVGLAAGLDKNGDYIEALGSLGFGFIEVGTVTPKPQAGNPKPRLFRLKQDQAIINRMGFNNKGVEHLKHRLIKTRYKGIIGVNIGKNKDTADSQAIDDYLYCLHTIYPYADYVTINISSPNTPGLRDLQKTQALTALLISLTQKRDELSEQHQKRLPLLVKIAPDLSEDELEDIANVLLEVKLDGIIISNTTLSRENLTLSDAAQEAGGLSGKPLLSRATLAQSILYGHLKDRIPIIGVGGIINAESAAEKFNAGAKLVQIYTGFIYQGPTLISEIVEALNKKNKK